MKKNLLFFSSLLYMIILFSTSFTQVIKKDGIYYRNHKFNPGVMGKQINSPNLKDESLEKTAADTIRLIKQDFMVNTLDGEYGAEQTGMSAAIDGNGNYVSTWIDYRNGQKQLYAQFYNYNDEKIGSNFLVSESALDGNNYPFAAVNKNGDFIITWLKDFSNVIVQRFNKEGQKIGWNIQVNSSWAWNTLEPSVAVNNDGSFLVTWGNDQDNQILARLYDKSGNPVTNEFIVSDQGLRFSSWTRGKRVAVDISGNYYIVWSSYSNSNYSNIYCQKINSLGQKVGFNTLVSDSTELLNKYFPEVVSTADGHFFIVWMFASTDLLRDGFSARILHSDQFTSDEFIIYEKGGYYTPFEISSDKENLFLVNYVGADGPYLLKIDKLGNFIHEPVKVKFNEQVEHNYYLSTLTDLIDNRFYYFVNIYRRRDSDIFAQRFDSEFSPDGLFVKINDDTKSAWQSKPLVHFNDTGESIVLWEDKRNGRSDLYAQVYDKNFNPVGGNIQLNEANDDSWFLHNKMVKHLSDGSFVIAFSGSDAYSYGSRVFLQIINAQGEKPGENVTVNEENFSNNSYEVTLNINKYDDILVCWYNYYEATIRKFNKVLSPLSSANNLMQSAAEDIYSPLAISIDPEFIVMVAWKNYNYVKSIYSNEIFGRYFDENGKSTSDLLVIDNSSNPQISGLNIINDNNNFALAYFDQPGLKLKRKYYFDKEYTINNTLNSFGYSARVNLLKFDNQKLLLTYSTPYDVFAFYANDNKRKKNLYYLHSFYYLGTFEDEFKGFNSADIYDDNLIFTYENITGAATGVDILAKVWNIDNTNFQSEAFLGTDYSSDFLFNNYPNPFNSNTRITYEILAYHKVKLAVYDVLGREIRVLVDTNQEKGIYEIDFNASDLPSGIYFCRLDAFNTVVKKMILLK